MPTINQNIPRIRVPNGTAHQRLRVAVTDDVLESIKADADENRRTVSSMASSIIAEYYEAKSTTKED